MNSELVHDAVTGNNLEVQCFKKVLEMFREYGFFDF